MTAFSKPSWVPCAQRTAPPFHSSHQPRATSHAFCSAACSAAALVVMAGCADLQWHQAGASAQAMESDLAECRGQARLGVGPDARLLRTDAGRLVGLTSSSIAPAASGRLDGERFLAEHDLTRICMNRRGYELAPAEKR